MLYYLRTVKEVYMIKRLSNNIASFLVCKGIVEKSDVEIYCYGTEQIVKNIIVFAVISIIATTLQMWGETICFFIGFMRLRVVAGGYHANTPEKCGLISLTVYVVSMIAIQYIYTFMTMTTIIILSGFIISTVFYFGPIDHKNRPIEAEEYPVVKKKSRIVTVTFVMVSIFIGAIVKPNNFVSTGIIIGGITASVSIIIGSVLRRREKNGKEKFNI